MTDQFKKDTISATVAFVKQQLEQAEGGHDWFHIERVWNLSINIARHEKADMFVVQLAALLHDIADAKFYDGDEDLGPERARQILCELNVPPAVADHIVRIIKNVSFKGGHITSSFHSLELDIVRDADRLDAIGAIGIARAFNYGGFKNRKLYDPDIQPDLNMSKEAYKKSTAPTINHFYEKLLLLKDKMNTSTGRKLAESRHNFLELYLDQFYREWSGIS